MKANEAPESKFVYPDKLYARCNNNKTLDISYAPQNMEAVEYVRTGVFIEKVADYIKRHSALLDSDGNDCMPEWIENLKKAMKL